MFSHQINSSPIPKRNFSLGHAASGWMPLMLALTVALSVLFGGAARAQTAVVNDNPIIPDEYIVVFKRPNGRLSAREVTVLAEALVNQHQGRLLHVFGDALCGFAARFTPAAVVALRADQRVDFIEANRAVRVEPVREADSTANQRIALPPPPAIAPWHLDRIDQHPLPLNGVYNYNYTGAYVRAYIIDTGIRYTHAQFGGRALTSLFYDAFGGNGSDCNGHGTHVAGLVGGATYGVAKNVELVSVRVLNCSGSGSYAGVIAGVNWVTGQRYLNPFLPSVANMSLGGPVNAALDLAIKDSINAGVTYTVAAGNDYGNDACAKSPARVDTAITVGATDKTDTRAAFSNTGSCISLFAPGKDIISSWSTSDTANNTISGTSMAAPLAAGVAALYLQFNPLAEPATVKSVLMGIASPNIVINAGFNSSNLLLYTFLQPVTQVPLKYQAFVGSGSSIGWQNEVLSPAVSGTTGLSLRMEAFKISIPSSSGLNISYNAWMSNIGFPTPHLAQFGVNGTVVGVPGARQLEAIQLAVPTCTVRYRAHNASLGWGPWRENSAWAGDFTFGPAQRLEAIQAICLCP